MFKFIHAADIHLDSPLKGLEQYEGAPAEEIRLAGRRALEGLVQTAVSRNVTFVLLAGDIYDGDWRDYNTGLYFVAQMARLRDADIPVYLVTGNHDAANRMTRSLKLPENVKVFDDAAARTFTLDGAPVAIHGQSYATAAVREDLSEHYPPSDHGLFNVGLLHTCATGREGHESYAPCTVEGLRTKGYQYWALGHIHKREVLCQDPWIAFSGNIQGRSVRETGPKGCLLVTVADDLAANVQFMPLDLLRWEVANINVAAVAGTDEVLDKVAEKLRELQQAAEDRLLAVRVSLCGRTPAHAKLLAQRHHWIAEIRARARDLSGGRIWVEKVLIGTSPPETAAKTDAIVDSARGEIAALVEELRAAPERLSELDVDFAAVLRALPGELQEVSEIGRCVDSAWLAGILEEAGSVLRSSFEEDEEKS